MRMPRLAIAVVLLALVTLAGISTYAGYLVVGMLADYLGSGRFVAGLLLGALFVRLPHVRDGKLRTIGLLPKKARLPIVLMLLAVCLIQHAVQRNALPVLALGLAASVLLTFRWIRQTLINRVSVFLKPTREPAAPKSVDPTIIDVDFREKKD